MSHGRHRKLDVALAIGFAVVLVVTAGSAGAVGRPGTVQFSDGEIMEGEISLSPGTSLRVHDGKEMRTLLLDSVREIRCRPRKEAMEQKWRFVEAGRTEKEKWGDPYPVRYIATEIRLRDEQVLDGHLYTTVLYVESSSATRKVVLRAKQRGEEGDRFEDLPYPVHIAFADTPGETEDALRIRLDMAGFDGQVELTALTFDALIRLVARPTGSGGIHRLPPLLDSGAFTAVRLGTDVLVAAWPAEGDDTADREAVMTAMQNVRDFFDKRTVVGVFSPDEETLYSLMMLERVGKTSLVGAKTQPWRMGIWRWKRSDDGNVMLAGRGYFFRGITSRGGPVPRVIPSSAMWNTRLEDGVVLPVHGVADAGRNVP